MTLINIIKLDKYYLGFESHGSLIEGPRSTTPPRRGWQSLHWSGVAKSYEIAVEVISSSDVNVGGARRSHYLRVCVCVCFGHKTTCVFVLVFSVFLAT